MVQKKEDVCPSCGKGKLIELTPGVLSCTSRRKIFRGEKKEDKEKQKGKNEIQDGKYFMKETSLNPKWEICEKGITIFHDKGKRWIAVLLCHSPNFPGMKYIRISWWKKSINTHAGMFKIMEYDELNNTIIALERINDHFDNNFSVKKGKKISYDPIPERKNIPESSFDFDMKKRLCPKCGWKMKKKRTTRYFECENCGEIIVIYEEQPIYDYPDYSLPLSFSTNFPINYYLPNYGISVKSSMGDWKAIVIIHPKENPDKKWLRFYWWQRDLQKYMTSKYSLRNARGLRWETKKGTYSPNIYEKENIPELIKALKKMKTIWMKAKGLDPKEEIKNRKKLIKKKILKAKRSKIPNMKNLKAEMVDWIIKTDKKTKYNPKALARELKADLFKRVNNLADKYIGKLGD